MSIGTLKQLEDLNQWDKLLARSPQRTRFLDRDFLKIFEVPIRYYGFFKKGVCIAGVPVIDASPLGFTTLPWCYFQGPVYFDEIYRSSPSRLTQYEIELGEEVLTQLAGFEPEFNLSVHPSITDIRGFDWVHYGSDSLPRCDVLPRYTAIIDLENQDAKSLRAQCRSARRQEEGYAISRENLETHVTSDCTNLIALYEQTFKKQDVEVPKPELDCLVKYCNYFADKPYADVIEIRNQDGETLAATLIFEDYDKTWHVPVVGVGETRYGGTLLYFAILDHALAKAGKQIDFNGANSPNRAYFKHSMGARPLLYFEVGYKAVKK